MRIRTRLIAAVVGVAVLGISTGAQAASSHKVNMLGKGGQTGVNLKSTYKGKPFGTCKMTGKLVIPNTQQTWKCKGGSFKLVGHGTTGAANDAKGTWKITQGLRQGQVQGHLRQGHVQRQALDRHLPLQGQGPLVDATSRRAPMAPGAPSGPRPTKGP